MAVTPAADKAVKITAAGAGTQSLVRRGDLVTVSLSGDWGKPRPALVMQTDLMVTHASLVVCPITSDIVDATAFRVTLEPNNSNGLKQLSQVMVDKISTLPRDKVSAAIGRISAERMTVVERALLLVVGLA
jgi:mRNA interferase MazF